MLKQTRKNISVICHGINNLVFCLKIFKLEFFIQALISRLILNKYGISIFKNLSLGADNQKPTKCTKLKLWLLFNGSLNILRFFYFTRYTSFSWSSGLVYMVISIGVYGHREDY